MQVSGQGADAFALEGPLPEGFDDGRGFCVASDAPLAVFADVGLHSSRDQAAGKKALGHAVPTTQAHSFGNLFAFELGECAHDGELELPHGSTGVDALLDRGKTDARGLAEVNDVEHIPKSACQAVEFPD